MGRFKENLIGVLSILLIVYVVKTIKYERKIQLYKDIKVLQTEIITSDSCTISKLRSIIKLHENHVYRMQLIAGIKNPDSVFTYKEKVCNPVNFKNLTTYESNK